MTDQSVEELLQTARQLDAVGDGEAALRVYLQLLQRDPTHLASLLEIARVAHDSGHLAAARTACEQAVRYHPTDVDARVNLGHLLYRGGDYPGAREHYQAALRGAPQHPGAHQGLSRALRQLGDPVSAERHRCRGFTLQPVLTHRYRGKTPSISVLLLLSTLGGNVPTRQLLDDRTFAVTALYPEFYGREQPLPAHDLVFNAIGDADLSAAALEAAQSIVARTAAAVINPPARVLPTGRAANAARLSGIEGLIAPRILPMSRGAFPQESCEALLAAHGLAYPLLLRAAGYHTGQHFVRVECGGELTRALAALPGESLFAIEYLDARARDGMARKYRVMYIDGALYPLHLAISADWKIHYFSSAMATQEGYRAEERRFLDDMQGVLGAPAVRTLGQVGRRLQLDYVGIDFGVGRDGTLLLFEANATMVINPPEPDPIWDYRRPAIDRALRAARQMLIGRSAGSGVDA